MIGNWCGYPRFHVETWSGFVDLRRWMWMFFSTSELTKPVATRLCCFIPSWCRWFLAVELDKCQNTSDFWDWKRPPRFYSSLSTNPLTYIESELCKWVFLDLFDVLNPPIISISPYLQALVALLATQRRCRFSKIPSIFVHPTTTALNYSQNFFQCGI